MFCLHVETDFSHIPQFFQYPNFFKGQSENPCMVTACNKWQK